MCTNALLNWQQQSQIKQGPATALLLSLNKVFLGSPFAKWPWTGKTTNSRKCRVQSSLLHLDFGSISSSCSLAWVSLSTTLTTSVLDMCVVFPRVFRLHWTSKPSSQAPRSVLTRGSRRHLVWVSGSPRLNSTATDSKVLRFPSKTLMFQSFVRAKGESYFL